MLGANGKMCTLMADTPEGPFAPSQFNFNLLAGQSAVHTYFTRFFPTPDGVLVNHHSQMRNGQVYFAPLKRAIVDAEGTLRLGWWEGNEVLKQDTVIIDNPQDVILDTTAGVIIEGTLILPKEDAPTGVWLGMNDGGRIEILTNTQGIMQICITGDNDGGVITEETIDREMTFPETCSFRLLVKHSLVEFYLDDILMQCYSMPKNANGQLGITGDIQNICAWQLPC